jgi:hypothetical protein
MLYGGKHLMRKALSFTFVVASLLLLATSASASTVYTTPVDYLLGAYFSTGSGPHNITGIQQFDPSLGTLTDVIITLNGFTKDIYTITDTSGGSNPYTVTATVTVKLANPVGPGSIVVTVPVFSDSGDPGAFGSYTNAATPGTASQSTGPVDITAPPALLTYFTGLGTVNLATSASGIWSNTADNANLSTNATYTGDIWVTYGYTQNQGVPEPATIGMMLGGLGCLAFGVRRRIAR